MSDDLFTKKKQKFKCWETSIAIIFFRKIILKHLAQEQNIFPSPLI